MIETFDEKFDAMLEPKGFDPDDLQVSDIPVACWYITSRIAPASLVFLILFWGFTSAMFTL